MRFRSVLVYTAQGLPLAVFLLSEFMRQIPGELKDAARCDGVSEYRIFFRIILPLTRPTMATVGIFTMIPIWNDRWFPLLLAPSHSVRTSPPDFPPILAQQLTAVIPVITHSTP